jgi:hypothetical protein
LKVNGPKRAAESVERRRRLNQRLRAEFIAGAEEEWRKRTGRPTTREALERVLRRYPGDTLISRPPVRASARDASRPGSEDSGCALFGCAATLAVVAVIAVDIFPFLAVQDAVASGAHGPWALILIAILGLASGPVIATAVGYVVLTRAERLKSMIEWRWPLAAEQENPLGPNLSELPFVAAVIVGLVAGAAVGSGIARALDAWLP